MSVIFPIFCLNTPSANKSIKIIGHHGTQCTQLVHAALLCFNIYLTIACMMQKTDIAEGINSLLLIHVLYIAFAWIILLWGLRE